MRGEKAQKSKGTQKGIKTENGKKVVRNKYLNFQNNSQNVLIFSSRLQSLRPFGKTISHKVGKRFCFPIIPPLSPSLSISL